MSLDNRDQSIVTQVSAKIAADLAIAAKDVKIEDLLSDFAVAFPQIREGIIDAVNAAIAENVLPGSTEVAPAAVPPPAALSPGPAPAGPAPSAGPAPGPAAIPGATGGGNEADWRDLFDNPGNWYDNRASKQNDRAPDFRHKTKMDAAGKYKLGLYVTGKTNPDWVRQHFGV